MAEITSSTRVSIARLIVVPGLITLGVTVLRLVGERLHWSPKLWNPSAGGGGALVGIAWLPIIFGPFFALKLLRTGQGAMSAWKPIGFTVLGIAIFGAGGFIAFAPQVHIPGKLLVGLLIIALAAAIQYPAWPVFFKTLLAYSYAARVPVVIVMFFAIRGRWGTHYDAPPPDFPAMSFWRTFFFTGVVPQLVFWVAYTVLLGALVGTIAAGVARAVGRGKPAPEPAS